MTTATKQAERNTGGASSPVWMAVIEGLPLIAGFLLLGLAGVVCADVILRIGADLPMAGLYEISALVAAVAMAASLVRPTLLSDHVGMDLFQPRDDVLSRLIPQAVTSVFIGALLWTLIQVAYQGYEGGETTLVVQWPTWPFWFAAFLMLVPALPALLAKILTPPDGTVLWHRGVFTVPVFLLLAVALVASVWLFGDDLGPVGKGVLLFAAVYVLAMAQVPIGISMGLVGAAGVLALVSPRAAQRVLQNEVSDVLSSNELIAIPLFLIMGAFAVKAGLATRIFTAARALFGPLRGGLAIATVVGCGGFGAISGSSVATTATLGRVAFDEMKSSGYRSSFASGSIAAGGTLGALIPPSVILIIYCVVTEQSIERAFAAALIPGLLAILLYAIAIAVLVRLRPGIAPEIARQPMRQIVRDLLGAWPPALLFVVVLTGLYAGFFTSSEAAAVGCMLALVFWVTSGSFSLSALRESLVEAMTSSAKLYMVILGASLFAALLNQTGLARAVLTWADPAVTPQIVVILAFVVIYLVLGAIFDSVAALLVTVPIVIPVIDGYGLDLVWWGIVTLSMIETGMITPPIGMNVFVLRGVLGGEIRLQDIDRGVWPFVMADLMRLTLLIAFPVIALWLPNSLQ
ncbi:MAG: TRAP transporter large permease [Pseudomonadota bacterium]|nr:TRAP transporter large permease [Pseudomonadota bacterium]